MVHPSPMYIHNGFFPLRVHPLNARGARFFVPCRESQWRGRKNLLTFVVELIQLHTTLADSTTTIMRYLFLSLILALALLSACRSGSKPDPEVHAQTLTQDTLLAEALQVGNLKQAQAAADSMSLFVDDFTPEQTVRVLMTFLSVHNDAVERRNYRRDLETLRKFVDVYDIALSVNPKDTRAAFEKAKRMNPAVDFDSIARVFRDKLAGYDAVQGNSLLTDTAPADTAAQAPAPAPADTAAAPAELPLELRPAE